MKPMPEKFVIDHEEVKEIANFLDDAFFSDPSISDERKNLVVELVVMKLKNLSECG